MIQSNCCFNIPRRAFSVSSCLYRRKRKPSIFDGKVGHVPFDPRLPVTGKNVGPRVEGGSEEAQRLAALHVVNPIGYYHDDTGRFMVVPEMIPEFIVPDLTNFMLKPYVPYNADVITQSKLTAKDLFDECFADDIEDAFKKGALQLEGESSKDKSDTSKERRDDSQEETEKFAELHKKADSK